MNHSIQSDQLIATISDNGAELISLVSKKTQKEYIWQADPQFWNKHAPILFPIVGRLKDGKYTYQGKEYELPIHGFASSSLFTTKGACGDSITFTLESSAETLAVYPFEFVFNVIFKLIGNSLETIYQVENKTDGCMYFSCGSHEGYSVSSFEDCYLEFDKDATYKSAYVSEAGLLLESDFEVIKNDRHLPLNYEFFKKNDCLVFIDVPSKKVTLGSKNNDTKIIVDYENTPNLVVWTREGAPYLCIEPWDGLPDYEISKGDFSEKPGMIRLDKGANYSLQHKITFEE